MFSITFPNNIGQKYYNTHYTYVLNIFKDMGCVISFEDRNGFIVTINDKPFLFDFADTPVPAECSLPMFKMHCIMETDGIHAFSPMSFMDWEGFREFSGIIRYEAKGDRISFRQRAYGNAKERRERVRKALLGRFGSVLEGVIAQKDYWYEINSTFIAVFVPGWCNTMVDRAQFQYMALGCCTISPRLPEILPFGKSFVPNEHYIMCKEDYSDLPDLIDFYRCCRDTCVDIGNNARKLFMETSTPYALCKWIESKIS